MNRGIARRTFFERPEDTARFESLLAEAVGQGWIEVHSYAFMSTHFHLLARSPKGELSRALRHVQLGYVRWFNRTRKRDGPLVRQRYRSSPVESRRYRLVLVGYIDANPPHARMAQDAASYPDCSAFHYMREKGPAWLERSWVEGVVCDELALERYDPRRYPEVFIGGFRPGHRELIEKTIARRGQGPWGVETVLGASDAAVMAWMRRKAALADGTSPGIPVVGSGFVQQALAAAGRTRSPWEIGARRRDGWKLLEALLLRQLAGACFPEIGRQLGCRREAARCCHADALEALRSNDLFAARASDVTRLAIQLCYAVGARAARKPG